MPKSLIAVALLVACGAFPKRAEAQGETTSAIAGQVTDQSGGAIGHATVTIVNVETGLRRTAETDGGGRFGFPQLRPGVYSAHATAPGFEPQKKAAVSADLGRTQTVDFVLPVMAAREEVTVTEAPPLLNTEN